MKTSEDTHSGFASNWGYLLHEVAKLLKRRFEEETKSYGITLPQFRALAMIATGKADTQSALAAAIDIDPMTMSGILDRLEKRGLITRTTDPMDSRAKLTAVTEDGRTIVAEGRNMGQGVLDDALVGIGAKDREALTRVLGKVRDNLQGEPARIKELQ